MRMFQPHLKHLYKDYDSVRGTYLGGQERATWGVPAVVLSKPPLS